MAFGDDLREAEKAARKEWPKATVLGARRVGEGIVRVSLEWEGEPFENLYKNGKPMTDKEYKAWQRIDLKPGRRAGVRRQRQGQVFEARRGESKDFALRNFKSKKEARPAIGRRKTVRTKVGRLVSRKSQRAVKSALFRSQVKKYPCPFCAREDFLGEKGLKKHIAKFHEAGKRSKRGYRTRRDA